MGGQQGQGRRSLSLGAQLLVAYPERITNGYDVMAGGEDIDLIEWNYAFGWQNPERRIIAGPIFCEMTRWGVVWPHPEHTNPQIKRDPRIHRCPSDVPFLCAVALVLPALRPWRP